MHVLKTHTSLEHKMAVNLSKITETNKNSKHSFDFTFKTRKFHFLYFSKILQPSRRLKVIEIGTKVQSEVQCSLSSIRVSNILLKGTSLLKTCFVQQVKEIKVKTLNCEPSFKSITIRLLFPRVQGFWQNVRQFFPRLRILFFFFFFSLK